jgi:hypothetical protein
MKRIILLLMVLTLATLFACNCSDTVATEKGDQTQAIKSEAEILQSWHGDYPVAQLNMLPEGQRENSVGYIDDAKTFKGVWNAFNPGEDVPEIDFNVNLVLFTRNTQFYNRTRIGKVNVTNGVAEVLAMETMSAMPIEEKVAMSLAVVPRQGITAIQVRDKIIPIITD